jgi:hypothetical protein
MGTLKKKAKSKKASGVKRGLSTVIVVLILVVLALVVLGLVYSVVVRIVRVEGEKSQVLGKMTSERISIESVRIDESGQEARVLLRKTASTLLIKNTSLVHGRTTDVDLVSVGDLSGTMVACWNIISQCCYDNSYFRSYISSPTYEDAPLYRCSDISRFYDNENSCSNECEEVHGCFGNCGGVWDDRVTPLIEANRGLINSIFSVSNPSRISVVAYGDDILEGWSTPLTQDVNLLKNTLDLWDAYGMTCICCGINEAADRLSLSAPEKSKVIIVMSDGGANVPCGEQGTGDAKQDAIEAACEANNSLANLTIHTVGIGSDVDSATLTEIANCGGGNYYPAQDADDLVNLYANLADSIKKEFQTKGVIDSFLIIFYNSTNSYKEKIVDIPQVLQTKGYNFNLGGKISDIIRIEIYAVTVTESGIEIIGPLSDRWEKK